MLAGVYYRVSQGQLREIRRSDQRAEIDFLAPQAKAASRQASAWRLARSRSWNDRDTLVDDAVSLVEPSGAMKVVVFLAVPARGSRTTK